MAYISLYRKYRPQRFADVVGQEHVVQTLQNALKTGRIANGYLFCGTRGVAKTTLARIFAKCLSCIGPDGTGTVPVAEPCNECSACKSISAGQCVDVIEMDAASNRSVNDMARIRENVQFGPMENRFKTYIVDEAHQLSSDAKDAFLKTLEEPPANVVFILATTESHAIPVTIASRCQQFDFKRGSIATISQQIERVLGYESVTMSPDAVGIVARSAEGSYRDALSLLEQVLAYKRSDVNARDVTEVLGAVDGEIVAGVVDAIAKADGVEAFMIAEQVFTNGKDVRQFLKTLSSRFRDLLYVAVGAKVPGEADVIGDTTTLAAQAKQFQPHALLRALEILAEAERETKYVNQHRLLLEMTLLRLMNLTVEPAPAAPSQPRPAAAAPVSRPAPRPTAIEDLPPPPTLSAPPPPAPVEESAPISASSSGSSLPTPPKPYVPGTSVRPPEPISAPTAPSSPVGAGHDPHESREQADYLRTHWQQVINQFQARAPGGVKVVQDCRPVSQEGSIIVLAFENKAYLDMLENARRRSFVEDVINKILRVEPGTFKVRGMMASAMRAPAPAAVAPRPVAPSPPPSQVAIQEDDSPLLDEVISIFGGKIIEED